VAAKLELAEGVVELLVDAAVPDVDVDDFVTEKLLFVIIGVDIIDPY